ncbi:MAG TPA: AMP-binding protein [Stellaceae bacterium]|nr:AMP-binding protein [Stellaceae bacterium]
MERRVADAFDTAAARWRDRPFLHVPGETARHCGIEPGPLRHGDVAAAVARIRARDRAAGYGRHDRAGLMLENRPASFPHWLARNGLGVSVVPLNPELRPAELDDLVTHSDIALAVGTAGHGPALAVCAAQARDLPGTPFCIDTRPLKRRQS